MLNMLVMSISELERNVSDGARLGTRFLVFPQPPFVAGYEAPEVVRLAALPGEIVAGPQDRRMYVVVPRDGKEPYQFPYLPPFTGAMLPPVEPGPDGNFDHLAVGTWQFEAAHVFACAARVLEIAESYWGAPIPWFFGATYERLEIVPWLAWDNAQSGFGFLEMGEDEAQGHPEPFGLNFDAVAHEMAHLVLFGCMGLPRSVPHEDFYAYHEAAADFLALLGLLHFDTALDNVLRRTEGNLLITNELDRFAELAQEEHIRLFSNSLTLSMVGAEEHDRSRPFGGALFDCLIEIYQTLLFERGLSELDPRRYWNFRTEATRAEIEWLSRAEAAGYRLQHFAYKSALEEARDIVGEAFVRSWGLLTPELFDYRDAALAIVESVARGRAPRFAGIMADAFEWREIL